MEERRANQTRRLDRGDKVDYHQYHLSAPPRGYEWRMVDGNYVLANTSNFQIRTVVRIP
jgi:Ni/Co efflux regulator RcnB